MATTTETRVTHTPGPWRIEYIPEMKGKAPIRCESAEGERIAQCSGISAFLEIEECMANALLMTAAPDLLSACRKTLALLEGLADEEVRNGKRNAAMNVRECEAAISAAIAKAEGGAA